MKCKRTNLVSTFKHAMEIASVLVVVSMLMVFSGCGATDDGPPVVTPQYFGMTGKTVAVMVSADPETLLYPNAPFQVSTAVSRRMKIDVTGVKTVDPKQIIEFQKKNPTWIAFTPRELLAELKVDRLVIIDLQQYTTHERGNRHVWKGTIAARATVYEKEDANRPAYSTEVTALYPSNTSIGVLDSDDLSIQVGMLNQFATSVSGRFRVHEKDE
jgi:hypothetical protein